jgi:hypothetical protein
MILFKDWSKGYATGDDENGRKFMVVPIDDLQDREAYLIANYVKEQTLEQAIEVFSFKAHESLEEAYQNRKANLKELKRFLLDFPNIELSYEDDE